MKVEYRKVALNDGVWEKPFLVNGISIPVTPNKLKFAVYLVEMILSGPYQQIVIVDRSSGSHTPISSKRFEDGHYCEYTVMNQCIQKKKGMIL